MEKKRTFAQWQKLYPDALKIEAQSDNLLSDNAILKLAYGEEWNEGKVLQDTSTATWTSKSGVKASIRAIVSKLAKSPKDE